MNEKMNDDQVDEIPEENGDEEVPLDPKDKQIK